MEQPKVRKGIWIVIGPQESRFEKPLDGYVFAVHDDCIEVGYLQGKTKAVKEDVIWTCSHWDFKKQGPDGITLGGPEASIVRQGPPRQSMDELLREVAIFKKETNQDA